MNKVISDNYPKIFEAVGDGSYLYHFGINEITNQKMNSSETTKSFEYYEVPIYEILDPTNITKATIAKLWPKDIEAKYINDYNASQMGIIDESYGNAYKDFIVQRKNLKIQIQNDYDNYMKNINNITN